MVWGIISYIGPGRLFVVEGNMNAAKYKDVLESRALPQLKEWFPNGNAIFMQDGAPCHKAKIIKQYLDSESIVTLDWPGNSPGLKPIENVWGIFKRLMAANTTTCKQELISSIIQHWYRDATLPHTLKKLIDSMPQRLRAVINAKGGHTKF